MKLSKDDGELLPNPIVFCRHIGRPLYLILTRPDLFYSVHRLSQYMAQPRQPHLTVAYQILQYLKSTLDHGLLFPTTSFLTIKAFANSDWASFPNSCQSTT